jgi:hypothetical protein
MPLPKHFIRQYTRLDVIYRTSAFLSDEEGDLKAAEYWAALVRAGLHEAAEFERAVSQWIDTQSKMPSPAELIGAIKDIRNPLRDRTFVPAQRDERGHLILPNSPSPAQEERDDDDTRELAAPPLPPRRGAAHANGDAYARRA